MTTTTQHHRRIELQSPADLSHLYALISTAAAAKIDLHLPPSAAPVGEDELRSKVETLVAAYVDETWALCRPNLSVNGVDLETSSQATRAGTGGDEPKETVMEEYEQYDTRLKERLEGLTARKNLLVAKVAEMRRSAPRVAAERFQAEFLRQGEEGEAARRAEEERVGKLAGDMELDLGHLERWGEVSMSWEGAVGGLGLLKGGLPEQRARLERAQGVVGYLEGK